MRSGSVANLAKTANNAKTPSVMQYGDAGKGKVLDFAVMPGLQLFQSLASGIVEYVIHGTGRKLKLLAGFNGLLAGKFCR